MTNMHTRQTCGLVQKQLAVNCAHLPIYVLNFVYAILCDRAAKVCIGFVWRSVDIALGPVWSKGDDVAIIMHHGSICVCIIDCQRMMPCVLRLLSLFEPFEHEEQSASRAEL